MNDEWRCYFEAYDGQTLVTEESWEDAEEAAMWGQRILDNPDAFDLLDEDDEPVSATEADPDREFTVELAE